MRGHTAQYKPMMAGHPPTQRLKEQEQEEDGFITTRLHLAVLQGGGDDIVTALSNAADVDAPDEELQTPLFLASQVGNVVAVWELLLHGADPNAQSKDGQTPLMAALGAGHLGIVQMLLSQGADAALADKQKRTALHIAAGRPGTGSMTMMTMLRWLLERGGQLEAQDEWGATPLHNAVNSSAQGTADLVACLLEHGADPMAAAWDQRTPLMLAARAGDAHKLQLLLTACRGDLRHLRDFQQNTVLHLAVEGGHVEIVEMLLNGDVRGQSLEDRGMLGWTPLQVAVRSRNTRMVALLLAAGASPDSRADDGLSSADYISLRLKQPRFAEIARLLSKQPNGTSAH